MIIVWLFALVSLLAILVAIYIGIRVHTSESLSEKQIRELYISMIVMIVFGVIGLLGSLPGLLYSDWYWFIDKLFSLPS